MITIDAAKDKAAWKDWRRRGLGASDAPAILGVSPYRTPLDVYLDKTGEAPDDVESLAMFLGHAAEPWIADAYETLTGHRIASQQVCAASEERPYLLATLDAIRDDGAIIEFKLVLGRSARDFGDEGSDELPDHFLAQATHQMIVADADRVDFAVASPQWDGLRIYPVRRDEALCRIVLDAAAEMHDRIIARDPPPITTLADVRHLPRLGLSGESVALDEAADLDWLRYEDLGHDIASFQKQRDAIKARLHAAMGTAAVGVLPSGGRLVRKLITRKAYACPESTYANLTFKKGE